MDEPQFNQLITRLANFTNVIQAQAIAAPPAREVLFTKIVDFYKDTQDLIR